MNYESFFSFLEYKHSLSKFQTHKMKGHTKDVHIVLHQLIKILLFNIKYYLTKLKQYHINERIQRDYNRLHQLILRVSMIDRNIKPIDLIEVGRC